MIILPKHFNGNDTYIVGPYVANGCAVFKYEDRHSVFEKHDVPMHIQKSLEEAYLENSKTPDDLEALSKSPDWRVRHILAKFGLFLDRFATDPDYWVRLSIAAQGHKLDILINDPSPFIRACVAERNYGLDILINDPSKFVRGAVRHVLKSQNEKTKHSKD